VQGTPTFFINGVMYTVPGSTMPCLLHSKRRVRWS